MSGTISQISGPISYHVILVDGHVIRQHVDHVCAHTTSTADLNPDDDVMEILAPTVSVDNTIQPIAERDSQSDKEFPTTASTTIMSQTVLCNDLHENRL